MALLFNGKFTSGWQSKNGPISAWVYSCVVSSDRLSILPSFNGRSNVGKFTTKSGDICNTTNGDQRNMIQTWGHPGLTLGSTIWIGFSFMLDPTWADNGTWALLWQFGNPEESLTIGKYGLYACQKSTAISKLISPPPIPNKWYDILIQLKLSQNTDGYYEMWLRLGSETSPSPYIKVHSSTGSTVLDDDSLHGLDHAIALYRGATATNTQTVYFADYLVGTTRADVETHSSTPTPVPVSQNVKNAMATLNAYFTERA